MWKRASDLQKMVYAARTDIDQGSTALKLKAMNERIDTLAEEQVKHLSSWEQET
jgi:S-adenosylhomocysteine hydrolase